MDFRLAFLFGYLGLLLAFAIRPALAAPETYSATVEDGTAKVIHGHTVLDDESEYLGAPAPKRLRAPKLKKPKVKVAEVKMPVSLSGEAEPLPAQTPAVTAAAPAPVPSPLQPQPATQAEIDAELDRLTMPAQPTTADRKAAPAKHSVTLSPFHLRVAEHSEVRARHSETRTRQLKAQTDLKLSSDESAAELAERIRLVDEIRKQ